MKPIVCVTIFFNSIYRMHSTQYQSFRRQGRVIVDEKMKGRTVFSDSVLMAEALPREALLLYEPGLAA
jgi:hypothetical protein